EPRWVPPCAPFVSGTLRPDEVRASARTTRTRAAWRPWTDRACSVSTWPRAGRPPSSRDDQVLQLPRVGGEHLDAGVRDEHRVRVPEPAEARDVDPRLDRQHHARLEHRVVADVQERALVDALAE